MKVPGSVEAALLKARQYIEINWKSISKRFKGSTESTRSRRHMKSFPIKVLSRSFEAIKLNEAKRLVYCEQCELM